ncbi:LysR substrate-binding domain-containing protein [Rhizobium sp. L1K21]|uniref:LysR substrate-binding domain-containing protein n=1 Tax=Rhizobium sp. L1K21 TaxID=2954933 RepID=UPI002092A874|nr:LysR substrate-binding domain-containing protein [Rhizobium sp. L1K21]MCO6188097.1 LysR substrate-binding domain-containing protein [Rhizobium sp. L1K21]
MKLSKQFPLNAMRVFEAVARHGSFTRAADELGMTQTAVSYQIKLLEENLGEQLFLRQPRQIVKTDVAERMLPDVVKAFELLNGAVSSARQASSEVLEVHAVPTFVSHWLAGKLGDFQLKNPSIAVRMKRIWDITNFERDTADVMIWRDYHPPPNLMCHKLGAFYCTPMLSPSFAKKAGTISKPEDLLGLPLIGAGQDDPCWSNWFSAAGIPAERQPTEWRYRYVEQDLCANTAMASLGVAMLDRIYFTEELAAGRLIAPFDLYTNDNSKLWLAYPHGRRNVAKIKAFRDWVTRALAEDIALTTPANATVHSV